MKPLRTKFLVVALVVTAIIGLVGCGKSSNKSSSNTTATTAYQTPSIATTDFTADFSAMAKLTSLAAKGQGKIGILLPETTTSARYTSFDAPLLEKALKAVGLTSNDYIITNAQGSTATEKTQAEAAMTQGATVLIMDPIDSGVGAAIESEAAARGVKVIDYDRLTLGGSRAFYVSFDNVQVGKLIGQGFVDCVKSWNVSNPNVLVMRGAPTDNNATLFANGYLGVLSSYFGNNSYVKVSEPAGTWDPPTAQTTFQQQYTAHKNINAAVVPNDDNANAVIASLKTLGIKPKTFPITGQDATVTGLQNILSGYQCGTVYKPIYLEAQAAVALALYLRAGETPPASLVNGQTADSKATSATLGQVPSSLLTPVWVTTDNMASTVVKDGFVPSSKLCTGEFASLCSQYGIS